MNIQDQLTELPLRDIHLPDPISWWPLAFGWWVVLGVLFLLAIFVLILMQNYLKPSLKKQASKALDLIEKNFQTAEDPIECLSELSIFLRRVVISKDHAGSAAGLVGNAWLKLLDRFFETAEFSEGAGQILLEGPYRPAIEKEKVAQLLQLCRGWVNRL